jgi:hypothetical protein
MGCRTPDFPTPDFPEAESWSGFPWKAKKIAWSDCRDKHATGKALAQILRTGMIGTTGSKGGTREKSRASAKGASVGRVYREVSFNNSMQPTALRAATDADRSFGSARRSHRLVCRTDARTLEKVT